jgi:acetyl-CoA carboxylase alpha subunit
MSRTQHVGAEERGQALVIAQSLMMLSDLRVPIISVVTGEGGSGGALALAVSDRLIMFSNTVFSVASAEACTSILCKNGEKDIDEMAAGMKLTAQDLQDLKITDEIIEEPIGGIHLDFTASAEKLGESIERYLKELSEKDVSKLVEERYTKLRNIGIFRE